LVTEFWAEVRARLIDRHGRKPLEAERGISRYRSDTEKLELGDVIYNKGVERTAEVIDGCLKHGWPKLPG
jgi:hypothetical protein